MDPFVAEKENISTRKEQFPVKRTESNLSQTNLSLTLVSNVRTTLKSVFRELAGWKTFVFPERFETINRSWRGVSPRWRALGASPLARSSGVQQSTRPQRERCRETIKARSVTFRKKGFNTSGSEASRLARVCERSEPASRRSFPARFPPIIYGDYYFRAV